jgi:predicted dehydrogenase
MRLAVIGAGDVAQRDYLPEMHRLSGAAELVAICSRTAERVQAVAAQYGIPAWYTDYERMLSESDADVVLNLTPMQIHGEVNLAVLQSGKHLYSEKPFAASAAEGLRLAEEAQRQACTVVAAPSVLLFPQVLMVSRMLTKGTLGEIHSVAGRTEAGVPPWPDFTSDPSQFFQPGGGPAVDMAVYPLHAITGLLGPVRRVAAMAARTLESFVPQSGPSAGKTVHVDVDDAWHILLDLGDARLATVSATYCVVTTKAPELELHGLRGTVAASLLDVAAPVEVSYADGAWTTHPVRAERTAGPDHMLGVTHLLDCVRDGSQPLPSVAHAIHVLDVLDHARRSAETGQIQEVTTPTGLEMPRFLATFASDS